MGGREGKREGGREGGREGWREGWMEGGRDGWMEGGMEGGMGAVSFLPVVAGKQEGDPERAQPSVLCIRLLVVADGPHELLDGHSLLVLVQVALGGQTGWKGGGRGGGRS